MHQVNQLGINNNNSNNSNSSSSNNNNNNSSTRLVRCLYKNNYISSNSSISSNISSSKVIANMASTAPRLLSTSYTPILHPISSKPQNTRIRHICTTHTPRHTRTCSRQAILSVQPCRRNNTSQGLQAREASPRKLSGRNPCMQPAAQAGQWVFLVRWTNGGLRQLDMGGNQVRNYCKLGNIDLCHCLPLYMFQVLRLTDIHQGVVVVIMMAVALLAMAPIQPTQIMHHLQSSLTLPT